MRQLQSAAAMPWQQRPSAVLIFAFAVLCANVFAQSPDAKVEQARYTDASPLSNWLARQSAPRPAPKANADQIELVRQLARQRGGQPEALAQIIRLARDFDEIDAASAIDDLASAHAHAGQLDLAAEARRVLVERFSAQPAAYDALLWLVRMYSSGEVAHSRREPSAAMVNIKRQLSPKMAAAMKEAVVGPEAGEKETTAAGNPDPLTVYALQLASQAVARQAALADDPALAFARSVAARKAGQEKTAAALLSPLKHRRAGDVWGDCARAEAWLHEGQDGAAPKPILSCVAAAKTPHLDGVLDEAFWQRTAVDAFRLPTEPSSASVRLAYDEEFLYLAIECRKAPGVDYPHDERPRPHDGDVEARDHVRLRLDVDRDYVSYYELLVDSRGWTADRCWGDASWNPDWFVAAKETGGGEAWVIEAAIPWTELASEAPGPGQAWTCAIDRRLPAQPHAESPALESFVLLVFDRANSKEPSN
jgi:hypothetical protein